MLLFSKKLQRFGAAVFLKIFLELSSSQADKKKMRNEKIYATILVSVHIFRR